MGSTPATRSSSRRTDVGDDDDFEVGRVAAIVVDCEIPRRIDLMLQSLERQARERHRPEPT